MIPKIAIRVMDIGCGKEETEDEYERDYQKENGTD